MFSIASKLQGYLLGGALIAATAIAAAQSWRLHSQEARHVSELQGYKDAAAASHRTALNAVNERLAAAAAHARSQKEKDDVYEEKEAQWRESRAADAVAARSLRDRLAAATARGRADGGADTAACDRDADRFEALGRLAGEGGELVAEARSLLRKRAAEVTRLKDQIEIDRRACSAETPEN